MVKPLVDDDGDVELAPSEFLSYAAPDSTISHSFDNSADDATLLRRTSLRRASRRNIVHSDEDHDMEPYPELNEEGHRKKEQAISQSIDKEVSLSTALSAGRRKKRNDPKSSDSYKDRHTESRSGQRRKRVVTKRLTGIDRVRE